MLKMQKSGSAVGKHMVALSTKIPGQTGPPSRPGVTTAEKGKGPLESAGSGLRKGQSKGALGGESGGYAPGRLYGWKRYPGEE